MKRQIVLLPAFLAKGLEFDRVYLWNIDQEKLFLKPRQVSPLYDVYPCNA